MPPRRINTPGTRESNRQQPVPSTSDHSDATKHRVPTKWNGDQLHRASWFNAKIKQAQNTFRFIQLVLYSTIPIPKSGATAVYNDEHACDHYFEQNVGSWTLCSQIPSKVTGKSAGLTMVFWRFWLRCEAAGRRIFRNGRLRSGPCPGQGPL